MIPSRDRLELRERDYFARFFGFAFGVNGCGGLFSIARSRSSARFSASSRGSRSRDSISRFCDFVFGMAGSVRRG